MARGNISELDAREAINELKQRGEFNPAMESYIQRNHPNLLNSLDVNPDLVADIQNIVDRPERKRKPKKPFKFSKYIKPLAAAGGLVLTSLAGYFLAKDDAAIPHLAQPMLDLEDIVNHRSSNLDESGLYLAEGVNEYKDDMMRIINSKTQLPNNAEIRVDHSTSIIQNGQQVNNTTAWAISLISGYEDMVIQGYNEYTGGYQSSWDQQMAQIWIDNSTGDLVVLNDDGDEIVRRSFNHTNNPEYLLDFWGKNVNQRYIQLDIESDGNKEDRDILLHVGSWEENWYDLDVGQARKLNAGDVIDKELYLSQVNQTSGQFQVRIGGSQYVDLNEGQRHDLSSDGAISLIGWIEDDNTVYFNTELTENINFRLPVENYQFSRSHAVNHNGNVVNENITKQTSALTNITKLSSGLTSIEFPMGDVRTPYLFVDEDFTSEGLAIHFEAEDNYALSKVKFVIKDMNDNEFFTKIYDNLSGDYLEGDFTIPINQIPFGRFIFEQSVQDWKTSSRRRITEQFLGVKDPDYSTLQTELLGDHLLINGNLNNSFGIHNYSISQNGVIIQEGELDISGRSVLEIVNLTGFEKGDYLIDFEKTRTEGNMTLTVWDEQYLQMGESQDFGKYEITLNNVTADNATITLRNRITGEEKTQSLNETDYDWEHPEDYLPNGTKILDLNFICDTIRNISGRERAGFVFSKTQNISVGETAEGFWEDYELTEIVSADTAIITRLQPNYYTPPAPHIRKEGDQMWHQYYIDIDENSLQEVHQTLNFTLDEDIKTDEEAYDEGYQDGHDDGHEDGHQEGLDEGYDNGFGDGNATGYEDGFGDGNQSGYNSGKEEGLEEGYGDGFGDGNQSGYDSGKEEGLDEGYGDGFGDGNQSGYDSGKEEGLEEGYGDGFGDGNNSGYTSGFEEGNNLGHEQGVNETEESALQRLAEEKRRLAYLGLSILPLVGGGYVIGKLTGEEKTVKNKTSKDDNGNGAQIYHSDDEMNGPQPILKTPTIEDELFESGTDGSSDLYSESESDSYEEIHEMFPDIEEMKPLADTHSFEYWLEKQPKAIIKLQDNGYKTMDALSDAVEDYDGSTYSFLRNELDFSEKAAKGLRKKLRSFSSDSLEELEE